MRRTGVDDSVVCPRGLRPSSHVSTRTSPGHGPTIAVGWAGDPAGWASVRLTGQAIWDGIVRCDNNIFLYITLVPSRVDRRLSHQPTFTAIPLFSFSHCQIRAWWRTRNRHI